MQIEKVQGFISGVRCDLCGEESETDFTYYSLDFKDVAVEGNRYVTGVGQLPVVFSADACPKCVEQMQQTVQVNYLATAVGVNCDLCGQKMRGSFHFFYCDLSEVRVKLSTGHLQCSSCAAPAKSADKACKCGCAIIAKVGATKVNDKYLQVALCQRDYDAMIAAVVATRQQASATAKSPAADPPRE